jgi:hypothetical protein
MAKFPNTNGYSFTWTQPYLPTSYNPFYERKTSKEQVERKTQKDEDLIASLDQVDSWVDCMTRYPDAEAMIERLKRDFLS